MFAYDREERRELKRGMFETSGAGVMVQNYEDPIKINKHVLIQSDELDTKTHHLSNTRVYYHPGYYTSGELKALNPLSPNGDQHQFSPNNIHTLSRDNVMRIYEMITKEKML